MNWILFLGVVISFVATLLLTPQWIKRAKKAQLTGRDMHKLEHREVAEMGGIVVLVGFLGGALFYIALRTFVFNDIGYQINLGMMAAITTTLIIAIIGIMDDILGWKLGLRQHQKPILCALAALPLMVVNAGISIVTLPFLGPINLGLVYPIILIPLIITITANGFNMLAGYNGLEAGQGIIILATLGIASWITGATHITMICFIMVAALIAFLYFNLPPAKVFPGDVLTYTVGALIGIVAILGNMERVLLLLFIPYIIEFFLKLRGKFRKESFARVLPNGSLANKYSNIYGLEHFAILLIRKIKKFAYEREVVFLLYGFQIIMALLAVFLLV
ncbi:glycosyl transferase family 4 [Candidatus Woesearchaeota archaeon]|mgnify:CR=1 FL=1|nr:MAG: glycosyl transferase family 4 [Candidatus Woesearchaeota archaeon]